MYWCYWCCCLFLRYSFLPGSPPCFALYTLEPPPRPIAAPYALFGLYCYRGVDMGMSNAPEIYIIPIRDPHLESPLTPHPTWELEVPPSFSFHSFVSSFVFLVPFLLEQIPRRNLSWLFTSRDPQSSFGTAIIFNPFILLYFLIYLSWVPRAVPWRPYNSNFEKLKRAMTMLRKLFTCISITFAALGSITNAHPVARRQAPALTDLDILQL